MTEAGEPESQTADVDHVGDKPTTDDDATFAHDSDTAAGPTADTGRRFGTRRMLIGIGIAAALVLAISGAAIASNARDDDAASPRAARPPSTTQAPMSTSSTTTTLPPTTTTTATATAPPTTTTPPPTTVPSTEPDVAPAAGHEDPPTPVTTVTNRVPVCDLGPWGESHPLNWDVPGPPDQIELVNGPNRNCTNQPSGCRVTISTTWSDGVTASDARVLTSPGSHTLDDGRGTTAKLQVSNDLRCSFSSATYNNVWRHTP